MVELNRLRTMPQNYDRQLFNDLYSKTEHLRRKLASQINPYRFGLSSEDILSLFDVKFIFVFSKFHDAPENKLTAMLISSLTNFKFRILRKAYTREFSQKIMRSEDFSFLEGDLIYEEEQPNTYKDMLWEYLKNILSDNALLVLETQLNPPPYILSKMEKGNTKKVPDTLILDYFGMGTTPKACKYLHVLKKEIREAINKAKDHFHQ